MKVVIFVAYVGISSGNSSVDIIKLKEGDVWEVDKYTMQFEDSQDLRKHNKKAMEEFKRKYPQSGIGAVRLFKSARKDSKTLKEWVVFYKKHLMAFPKIIQNPTFMAEVVRYSSSYFAPFDKRILLHEPKKVKRHMGSYCMRLKKNDKSLGIQKGYGPKYLTFVREMIYQYGEFLKRHPEQETIDQIYENMQSTKKSYRLMHSQPEVVTFEPDTKSVIEHPIEIDPDYEIFDERTSVELEEDRLREFVMHPHFSRHYEELLDQYHLFLIGNRMEDVEDENFYREMLQLLEDTFYGNICCPNLFYHSADMANFNQANIVICYVHTPDRELEKQIMTALTNKANVAIFLKNLKLQNLYEKKFPEAKIIPVGEEYAATSLDQFSDFMISIYNQEKGKKYYK